MRKLQMPTVRMLKWHHRNLMSKSSLRRKIKWFLKIRKQRKIKKWCHKRRREKKEKIRLILKKVIRLKKIQKRTPLFSKIRSSKVKTKRKSSKLMQKSMILKFNLTMIQRILSRTRKTNLSRKKTKNLRSSLCMKCVKANMNIKLAFAIQMHSETSLRRHSSESPFLKSKSSTSSVLFRKLSPSHLRSDPHR